VDPKFLDLHYEIQPTSDYCAKFRHNQPAELEDSWAIKNICSKT